MSSDRLKLLGESGHWQVEPAQPKKRSSGQRASQVRNRLTKDTRHQPTHKDYQKRKTQRHKGQKKTTGPLGCQCLMFTVPVPRDESHICLKRPVGLKTSEERGWVGDEERQEGKADAYQLDDDVGSLGPTASSTQHCIHAEPRVPTA